MLEKLNEDPSTIINGAEKCFPPEYGCVMLQNRAGKSTVGVVIYPGNLERVKLFVLEPRAALSLAAMLVNTVLMMEAPTNGNTPDAKA